MIVFADPHLVHDEVHLAAADQGDRGARSSKIAEGLAAAEQRAARNLREADAQGRRRDQGGARAGQRDHRPGAPAGQPDHRQGQAATRSPKPTGRRRWPQAEIDAWRNRAREELREQVAALAVAGAEKILQREIDANAHKALLDQLAAEI